MQLLFQPKVSHTCGQYCVAMIAGISANKSILTFNQPTNKGTTGRDCIRALESLGIITGNKVQAFKTFEDLPPLCIIGIKWKKRGGHWMVWRDGVIYCPGLGRVVYKSETFEKILKIGTITQFIRVEGKK